MNSFLFVVNVVAAAVSAAAVAVVVAAVTGLSQQILNGINL